jgi:hypothetical protein
MWRSGACGFWIVDIIYIKLSPHDRHCNKGKLKECSIYVPVPPNDFKTIIVVALTSEGLRRLEAFGDAFEARNGVEDGIECMSASYRKQSVIHSLLKHHLVLF